MCEKDIYYRLKEVRRVKEQIEELLHKKEDLESCLLPGGIDYSKDKVISSPTNTLEKMMAKIAEVDDKIAEAYKSMPKAVDNVSGMIETLEYSLDRSIMRMRYIKCISAEEIAEKLNYSPVWIYKRHRLSVNELKHKEYSEV